MSQSRPKTIPLPGISWRGMTLQMFAIVVLPLTILLLVVAFGSLHYHQQAMRNLVGERDQRVVRTSAHALQEQLLHRLSAVEWLSVRLQDGGDPLQVLTSSQFLSPDFQAGLAVFSSQGELMATTTTAEWWQTILAENPGVLETVTGKTGVSPLVCPPDGSGPTALAIAQNADGTRVVGAFHPQNLAQNVLTGAFSPNEQVNIFLVGNEYQSLYQSGPTSAGGITLDHPGLDEALRGESGVSYLKATDGEHVVAFSPVLPAGWALLIEEPWQSVSSPWLRTTQFAPLIVVPVTLFALLALWFGLRQVVEPLQELENRAAALAWGDDEAIDQPVNGIEEVQRLQRELAHLARKVRGSRQNMRDYIGAITKGQEEERRRLARELHDDTLQALIALQQRIQLVRLKLAEEPRATEPLAELQALTEDAIQNLRRLTGALRPLYLEDLGLVSALEMLAQEDSSSVLIVEFVRRGVEKRLPPEIELALFRMAQEALNNVIRHAHASQAQLLISFSEAGTLLEVRDNGVGFDVPESPAEFAPGGHYGLLGLFERAELIGAHLEIYSSSGNGALVKIALSN